MWLRCVFGLSLRAAMSSIIRRRSGLTVLVSLMGSSILSEVDNTLDLRMGLSNPPALSCQLASGLSALAPAQRAGAQRLCALTHRVGSPRSIGALRKVHSPWMLTVSARTIFAARELWNTQAGLAPP